MKRVFSWGDGLPSACVARRLIASAMLAASAIVCADAGAAGNVETGMAIPQKTGATETAGVAETGPTERFSFSDLLPMAWQKRPNVRFHVFTEMTPAGRERRVPTVEKPLHYFSPEGTYLEKGWQVVAGEKPPPWLPLREAIQGALATNGYSPIKDDRQRPDVLIVFSFGSFSTDLAQLAIYPPPGTPEEPAFEPVFPPPVTAEELLPWLLRGPARDAKAIQDVVDRARFIGGGRIAQELRTALSFESNYNGPDGSSPVQILLRGGSGDTVREILELAFHTCYFVTATAFDFSGVEKKQKQLLWQTRMTVEAQGVAMHEVLKPLIVNTGPFLGRETPEAVIVQKRISREGRVEIGTPTVVPDSPAAGSKTDAKK